MANNRASIAIAAAAITVASAHAGFMDPPDPKVFAHAKDRELARLTRRPCTEADVGHGCRRVGGGLVREGPCLYQIDDNTFGVVPTDQCYKMDAPRRFSGTWIDAFEGQSFIPDGTTPPAWPVSDPKSPEWRAQFERLRSAAIWLDVEHANIGHDFANGGRRMHIEFVGRKTTYPGGYGHMGMFGNEIVVDRVISLREIDAPR